MLQFHEIFKIMIILCVYFLKDALTFGRPGCGAPVRTRSGRIRTQMIGNPEIRFQPNESVQKTIYNTIRYSTDPESKATYQAALGKYCFFSCFFSSWNQFHENFRENGFTKSSDYQHKFEMFFFLNFQNNKLQIADPGNLNWNNMKKL